MIPAAALYRSGLRDQNVSPTTPPSSATAAAPREGVSATIEKLVASCLEGTEPRNPERIIILELKHVKGKESQSISRGCGASPAGTDLLGFDAAKQQPAGFRTSISTAKSRGTRPGNAHLNLPS